MFTACGHDSAPGARAAVLSDGVPDTLRRTVVLLGLLVGALTTSWFLGTASAQAEELDLTGGVEEVQEQVDGAVETGAPEAPEAPEATEIPEAPEPSEVPDEPVDELGDSVTDTAQETTGTVDEATGALEQTAPDTPDVDVVGHVHETVDGVTDEVDQRVEAADPAPETGTGGSEPERERTDAPAGSGSASEDMADSAAQQAPSPAQILAERDDRSHQATADDGAEQSPVSPDAGPQNPTTAGAASANSGAPVGAVAGFLPATGAPAPAPGPEQAALDVLRAVPAADAGEPTVAPD